MPVDIGTSNWVFILAYAFDLKWDYLERKVGERDIEDLSFFELLVFVLSKWTQELVRHGLYRTFINVEEETKRIRGRLLLDRLVKIRASRTDTVFCQFDDLSFDVLENQILLSTLLFCERCLSNRSSYLPMKKRQSRKELQQETQDLIRLLSSQISYQPLSQHLFNQLLFHRMNITYRPILQICRFIFDSAVLYRDGDASFLDVPEEKLSDVFERFLRNYLDEHLVSAGLRVSTSLVKKWVSCESPRGLVHMPSICPDIVIRRGGTPRFIIDAKFYKTPVYEVRRRYSDTADKDKTAVYRTHSHNLYQLIAYTDYFNCDGLLVYAQTETGYFEEMVKIDPRYYQVKESCYRRFGFLTLDLSGELEAFKERMEGFAYKISEYCR
jgi:5-methylcytosine-specific restriction enzyme subunit McrC